MRLGSSYKRFDYPSPRAGDIGPLGVWATRFFGFICGLGLMGMLWGLWQFEPHLVIALGLWFALSIPVGLGVGRWLGR